MPVPKVIKVSRKTFLNPTAWIDFESLKQQNAIIFHSIKNIFTIDKPEREESFDEAIGRLQLSEKEIQSIFKMYHRYAIGFSVLGLLVFLYAFYLIFRYYTITGWLLGLVTSALLFTQAFKYDFWALQIKSRKLGMTFEDWKRSRLGGASE